jgi:tRNA 5-methylaminomethyl-2-thiouridine biosynthesis bifunctional protein
MSSTVPPLISNAELIWQPDGLPRSARFDDIYFSSAGALAESRHVFLTGNDLPRRWQQASAAGRPRFTVAELGFGSGLNFLLTCQAWQQWANPQQHLHYLAFEQWPLTRADLARVLALWPELDDLARPLLRSYPEHTGGLHRLQLQPGITLDIHLGDALEGLVQRHGHRDNGIDCWYLDGFAPARNPQLWSLPLLRQIARHSAPGATLSTYSVAGSLRRDLRTAGFTPHKLPGFGNKREMLMAHCPAAGADPADPSTAASSRPWLNQPLGPRVAEHHAVVIGAGLAGCATAHSLARRGWRVTLLEREALAAGASGNRQAVLQCRLATNGSAASRFHLLAYLYANRHFAALRQERGLAWQDCGILQIGPRRRGEGQTGRLADFYDERVLQALEATDLSQLAGLPLIDGGYLLPQGGWLDPVELCRLYCDDPLITLRQATVTSIQRLDDSWRIMAGQEQTAKAGIVVLANAHLATRLEQAAYCPLIPVRGQVTYCQASPQSRQLQKVVAGEKYVCPATDGIHTLGASFQPGDTTLDTRQQDSRQNLDRTGSLFAAGSLGELVVVGERAALRCSSRDHVPIVGPLSDASALSREFAPLARNAKSQPRGQPAHFPGFYITAAHGSHGLATAPLAGEIIAGLICNESLPVSRPELDCLNPARFIIRDLKRQRRNLIKDD